MNSRNSYTYYMNYLILSAALTSFSSSSIPLRAMKMRMALTIGNASMVPTLPSSTATPIYHTKTMNIPARQSRAWKMRRRYWKMV